MSEVYLAYDARAERSVVVKLMRPEQANDPELRERFLQEGRLACRCSHPNVITTYETDEDVCGPYIVMERLQGQSLREVMNSGALSTPLAAVKIAAQLADALYYLHEIGILHRDIKPPNVFVSVNGHVKIFDFGIARGGAFGLTRAGDVIGTPNYMAPEQILAKPVDERTDIYSFGVLLFEMLTLSLPYRGSTIEEITAVILNAPPDIEALKKNNVPEPIISLVVACLEKKPENRPPSFAPICRTFREFLATASSEVLSHPASPVPPYRPPASELVHTAPLTAVTPQSRSRLPIFAVALIILAIAAGLFFYLRSEHGNATVVSRPKPAAIALAPVLNGQSGQMLLVPGGPASLGNPAKPRQVTIPAFYIDKEEVSQDLYARFCRETEHPFPKLDMKGGNLPVVGVSFYDAQAFAKWAGERLPTADEWEKAARGPDGRKYPWGNQFKTGLANVRETNGLPGTLQAVDSHLAGRSVSGALNMLGNVWEWVNTSGNAPTGPDFAQYRVIFRALSPPLSQTEPYYLGRGGSFAQKATPDQLAQSLWDETPFPARAQLKDLGFRCARNAQ